MNKKLPFRILTGSALLLAATCPADDKLPLVDISADTARQTVVAEGREDLYQGHPTTILTRDGKKVFCVWTTCHGGPCGPAAESFDGGRTWRRVDERFPEVYRTNCFCCPTLQRATRADGAERWLVFSRRGPWDRKRRMWFGDLDVMASDDEGKTWRELGPFADIPTSMPPTGWLRLKDGSYALFGQSYISPRPLEEYVWMSVTRDGGESWSATRTIARKEGKWLCEPFALRSPDGNEIAVLLRENRHKGNSMVVFSRDEGQTWTEPVDTCWGLTGDRHQAVALPDGRLVVAFRDRALGSSSLGEYVAWVGTYDDIRHGRPGQYRIHLVKSHYFPDTGYSGVALLPNGEILCTTYVKYWPDNRQNSVVCTRFKIAETDRLYEASVRQGAGRGEPVRLYIAEPGSWVSFFEHKDGGIVCAAKGWYRKSDDNGRTWQMLHPFGEHGGVNNIRLKDGRLMSVWQIRTQNILTNELGASNFYVSFSKDEGKTWEGKVPLSEDNRRLYLMNDRPVRLSTGRILVPFALHPNELLDKKLETAGWAGAFYSDDEGQTWHEGQWLKTSVADQLCEPVVFECSDGTLKMLARTGRGYLYQTDSRDGGETWCTEYSTTLRSPCAPFFMRKDPYTGWVFVAWDNSFPGPHHQYPRCSLSLGVSRDDGKTWEFVCDIENDPMSSYGYPSIFFTKDEILVAYYEEPGIRAFNAKKQKCKLTIFNRANLTVDHIEKLPLLAPKQSVK